MIRLVKITRETNKSKVHFTTRRW